MRKLTFVLLLVAIAIVGTAQGHLEEVETFENSISLEDSVEDSFEDESPTPRGLILSSQAKKAVKGLLKQLPCGWPSHGIPPLAPYRNEELNVAISKSFLRTATQMLRLKVDGLDDVKIKKMSVSYINKKVKFHFIFKKIQATANFNTDTFADLMEELGLRVRYEGKGDLDFSLINLSIKGSFKYKLPLFFGSAKIYKWNAVVTLGDCKSNITGLVPLPKYNLYLNDKIEDSILSAINDNQRLISDRIEEAVVPTVNDALKGNKLWDLITMKPPASPECIPPPDPWARRI